MKVGKYIEGRFQKGSDEKFEDGSVDETVDHVEEQVLMGETKLVLFTLEDERGIVLNKVNTRRLIDAFGSDDTADWIGGRITLYTEPVEFNGKTTEAIRIKKAKSQKAPLADEKIPF